MHTIAYSWGARQSIIAFFFQRFYEACLREGIPPVWDEESGPKVLAILNKLNFDEYPTITAIFGDCSNIECP